MNTFSNILVAFVAVFHVWVFILESFLWTKPIGMKIFRTTPAVAQTSKVLAFNQGIYNAFLAAGLITSLMVSDPSIASAFRLFFLVCVVVAGIAGGLTSSIKILIFQGLPAVVALAVSYL